MLLALGALVVSVAVALLTPGTLKEDVLFSICFTVLTYIVGVQHSRLARFRRIEGILAALRNTQIQLVKFNQGNHDIIEKALSLLKSEKVLQSTGFFALERAIRDFSFVDSERYIRITGRELAFLSYEHFWQKMLELQIERRRRHQTPMVARATHVSEIGEWNDSRSRALKDSEEKYEKFIAEKGVFFRIFLDCGDTGRIQDYTEAIKVMRSLGIHCAYIQFGRTNISKRDSKRDFCLISPHRYSSDWLVDSHSRVEGCEIGLREDRFDENMACWNKFVKAVRNYDYANHTEYSEEIRGFLRDSRDSFIAAIDCIKQ